MVTLGVVSFDIYMWKFRIFLKQLFPKHRNDHDMKTRNNEAYHENMSNGKRYAVSAVPNMQKLLNKERNKQRILLKRLRNSYMSPTNFAYMDLLLR